MCVLVMDRSGAAGVTMVGSTAVSSGSAATLGFVTVTVLVNGVPAFAATFTVSVITAVPTGIAAGLVQVTTCATAEQVNPPPVPLTNVNPTGRVSVTVVVPVGAAPETVTVMV